MGWDPARGRASASQRNPITEVTLQADGSQGSFVGNRKPMKVWWRADQISTLGKKTNLCFEKVSHSEKN